jgi:PAS domain S-box-containing protein
MAAKSGKSTSKMSHPVKKTSKKTISTKSSLTNKIAPDIYTKPLEMPQLIGLPFPIVGIDASACGLEALELFLKQIPPTSGLAFVIVRHMDPTRQGLMAELLQHAIALPVVQVKDRVKVEPDHVYVIPPNRDMSLLHGVLHLLEPTASRDLHLPIDFFSRQTAVIDITGRKQVEEKLRSSEERNRLILQTATSGFWCLDMNGHILQVNEAYCRMSGYSEQELLTMKVADLEAAETSADITAHLRKIIAHGVDNFESVHRRKDGSTFPVEVSSTYNPVEGGLFFGFIRDIARRKEGQMILEESRDRLRVRSQELDEMNSALKVLLKQREKDKQDLEQSVLANVKQFVLPYIEKLKKRKTGEDAAYLNIIEANLHEIISSFAKTMSGKFSKLTPQELIVVNLIKEGRQNKDISEMLHASIYTIKAHRRNIRKKLNLAREKTNLRTFLSGK